MTVLKSIALFTFSWLTFCAKAVAQDTARIGVWLRSAVYQIKKPGSFKADLDSAADLINQARMLNQKAKDQRCAGLIALTSSWLDDESGRPDQSKKDAEDAIRFFTAAGGNFSALGDAWFQHSRFYPEGDGQELKIEADVAKAADCFRKDGNDSKEAYARQFLGDMLNIYYQYPEAHKALMQSLFLYRRVPGANLEGLYDLLGYNSNLRGDYTQAIKYGLLALTTAEAHQDSSALAATVYGRLAYAYLQQHEYQNSILTAQKGLRIAEKLDKIDAIYIVGGVAATGLSLNSQPQQALQLLQSITTQYPIPDTNALNIFLWSSYSRAYTKLGHFAQGQQAVDNLLALLRRYHVSGGALAAHYAPAIEFFLGAGKLDSSKKYIAAQYAELQHNVTSQNLKLINSVLQYRLDTSEHQYKAAFAHLLRHKLISDSLLDDRKITEIADLEMEYETEKKANELKLKDLAIQTLTQKELLQRANLRRAELFRNITIAAGCLLAFILILLFRQYRLKHRTNNIISDQNHSMQYLLMEKEGLLTANRVLVRELHHRIKNNLQMVTSLLEAQAANLEAEALLAVQQSQHRVQAISLIHQKLYLREDVTAVMMSAYLSEIVSYLEESFHSNGNIVFTVDLEPIALDVDQAIPIGLIVNETITNSIKYAFPDGRKGNIHIAIKPTLFNEVALTISDNGVGFSQKSRPKENDSLGFNLIRGLSKSLRGALSVQSDNGTTIALVFPLSTHPLAAETQS